MKPAKNLESTIKNSKPSEAKDDNKNHSKGMYSSCINNNKIQ